ncbi:MAG: DUF2318 domain-containing protein [Synergistaceae bacterium]|jgi:uncharacterized membrane protein|nr:DUF2318 domain-containing protein [Synergistaceae bacterium]
MLEYLIKITNNTFYAAVPMSVLFAMSQRSGKNDSEKYIRRGLLFGFAAAFIYAVLKRNTGFAVREYYDLGALAVAFVFGALFLIPSVRTLLGSKISIGTFAKISIMFAAAGWSANVIPNLLLYPFEFAVGMDNIFNTEFMFKVIGYASGLLLTVFFGYAVYRISCSLGERFLASALVCSVLSMLAKEGFAIVQILLGRDMISRVKWRWLTRRIMWADSRKNFFLYLMLAVAASAALALAISLKRTKPAGDNPAQIRRARYLSRKNMRFCAIAALGVILSLLTVTVGVSYSNRSVELSPPLELPPAEGGDIIIPLEMVGDGALHRFVHKVPRGASTVDVRYIVIKKNDAAYGVGLDACDVCGPTGYYERKGQVVCILCDVVMNKSTIGLPGGCNPVPLTFGIAGGNMIIKTSDLAAEARRF